MTSYCDVIVVKKFPLSSIGETSGFFFNASSVIVSSTMRGRNVDWQRKKICGLKNTNTCGRVLNFYFTKGWSEIKKRVAFSLILNRDQHSLKTALYKYKRMEQIKNVSSLTFSYLPGQSIHKFGTGRVSSSTGSGFLNERQSAVQSSYK